MSETVLVGILVACVTSVGGFLTAMAALRNSRTSAKSGDVADLSKIIEQYRLENADLRKRIEAAEGVIAQLKSQHGLDQERVAELGLYLEAASKRIEELEDAHDGDLRKISELQTQGAEQETRLNKQQLLIAQQASQIADLGRVNCEFQAKVEALTAENAELRSKRKPSSRLPGA